MKVITNEFTAITDSCQQSQIGKLLPNALYVHRNALKFLDPVLQQYEKDARELAEIVENATIVKFATDKPKLSYLYYPDFDCDPHPKLQKSIIVDLKNKQVFQRQYQNSNNPPILHRKETFVTQDYPLYEEFAQLTAEEVALGLLDNSRVIGTLKQWQQLLFDHGLDFAGHHVVCPLNNNYSVKKDLNVDRHRAALHRQELSRPVRIVLEAELFSPDSSFFDYGCGHGGDVTRIAERGYTSSGWDPYYYPDNPLQAADIVNLGYIINVIEDVKERREALVKAWSLTKNILIVSAQVLVDNRQRGLLAYGDGILTSRNTLQKYYEQEELKNYINSVLELNAIAVGLGVFLVFRDSQQAESFRASGFVSHLTTPRVYRELRDFKDYQELLTPLMEFYTARGRLPAKGELAEEAAIKEEFKTYRRAFNLILQSTNKAEWDAIKEKRRQDLLVYLALGNFQGRPTIRRIAPEIKEDAKALLISYKQACLLADILLLEVSNLEKIGQLCQESSIGKQLQGALAIHVSALEKLPPLLRVYEGCASRVYGRLEKANIVKLYYNRPKISYLYYPNFDTVAHPTLKTTMEVDLQSLAVVYNDLSDNPNPPILHRKNALVAADYPHYAEFSELTVQEQELGLLTDSNAIRRLQGWQQCLQNNKIRISGHKIY
ncbi:MAG: DNA phosphorothioation-associated putative methyltransferase [Xenococcus sp. (in: cyanobacteria)]